MDEYIIALDQGTTSSRCIIFNQEGKPEVITQKEFTQHFPKSGWVEHDPEEIFQTQLLVMKEAADKMGSKATQIKAVGITNQRETTIVWDKTTGKPVYPAIVWQCRRTAEYVDEIIKKGFKQIIKEKTGLLADAYFSATKIRWILEKIPGAREKAEKGELLFGTVDTWLIYRLTGGKVFATDYTNASRTMLFNINTLKWDKELLELFEIPESMLPKVHSSSEIYGYTDEEITGFTLPIAGVAGDQQAALFGQGCFHAGEMKNTYGTGCFLLMNTGSQAVQSEHGLLTTIAASLPGKITYALEGSVFVAGALIQWLRDEMGLIDSAAESEKLCNSVEDTNGVYIVPAFTGLGAPYWDPYARGLVCGLSRGTTKAQFVRAGVEALAYQTYDVMKAMEEDAGQKISNLKADGGASANGFLMQFQADLLDKQVYRPKVTETTALGAAYLAGLAVGMFKDTKQIQKLSSDMACFQPKMDADKRKNYLEGWKDAVSRSKSGYSF